VSVGSLIDVPDVIGKTAENADQILGDAGFTKVTFVTEDGEPVEQLDGWTVTEQDPTSGNQAAADAEIILTVTDSTGPGLG